MPAHPVKVLVDTEGSAPGKTPEFSVGPSWTLAYFIDCGVSSDTGTFKVYIDEPQPVLAASYIGQSPDGADVPETKAGTFTLSVQSTCAWHVQAYQPAPAK